MYGSMARESIHERPRAASSFQRDAACRRARSVPAPHGSAHLGHDPSLGRFRPAGSRHVWQKAVGNGSARRRDAARIASGHPALAGPRPAVLHSPRLPLALRAVSRRSPIRTGSCCSTRRPQWRTSRRPSSRERDRAVRARGQSLYGARTRSSKPIWSIMVCGSARSGGGSRFRCLQVEDGGACRPRRSSSCSWLAGWVNRRHREIIEFLQGLAVPAPPARPALWW